MKINFGVRAKHPCFWGGLLGVILTAMGVSAEMFTSWAIVAQQFKLLISNPFMLGSVVMAVIGVLIDPTTCGIKDSEQALCYQMPKKEAKEGANDGN